MGTTLCTFTLEPFPVAGLLPLQTCVGSVVGGQWGDGGTDLSHLCPTKHPFSSTSIQVCPPILQQLNTGEEFNRLDLSLFATVNIHGCHELVLYPLGVIQ